MIEDIVKSYEHVSRWDWWKDIEMIKWLCVFIIEMTWTVMLYEKMTNDNKMTRSHICK